mgnify:CR=1 FL=1
MVFDDEGNSGVAVIDPWNDQIDYFDVHPHLFRGLSVAPRDVCVHGTTEPLVSAFVSFQINLQAVQA